MQLATAACSHPLWMDCRTARDPTSSHRIDGGCLCDGSVALAITCLRQLAHGAHVADGAGDWLAACAHVPDPAGTPRCGQPPLLGTSVSDTRCRRPYPKESPHENRHRHLVVLPMLRCARARTGAPRCRPRARTSRASRTR